MASRAGLLLVAAAALSLLLGQVPPAEAARPWWARTRAGRRLAQEVPPAPTAEDALGGGLGVCNTGAANSVVNASWAPRSTIFDQLALEELASVEDFLIPAVTLFNEHDPANYGYEPQPTDNHLYRIELLPPAKGAALAYLDGRGPQPLRFARAIVFRGRASPRDVMEYKVGPLPLDPDTATIAALRRPGEIPFMKHPLDVVSSDWTGAAASGAAFELRALFRNMTGGKCYGTLPPAHGVAAAAGPDNGAPAPELSPAAEADPLDGCTDTDIEWLEYPTVQPNASARISVLKWQFIPGKRGGDENFLHPLPLSWKVDETGPDPSVWPVYDFEYCHQGPFASAQDLLQAFQNGSLAICSAPEWGQPDYNWTWSSTERPLTKNNGAKPSPRQFAPQGWRFSVSSDSGIGRRLRWLGWEAHVTVRPDTGIAFNDITFRGQRLAYEVANQDMFVQYSGYGGAGQTLYMDSSYGIGVNSRPLVKGRDCPFEAFYADTVLHYGATGGGGTQHNVVCIFEQDMAEAAWRHTHATDNNGAHSDGVRGVELIVRSISTIGNYDYQFELRFKLDASMEVRCTLAGYMSSLFFEPSGATFADLPFGTRVQKYTLGNLHDHLNGWKVDLDVGGRNNTFMKQVVRAGTYAEALAELAPGTPAPGWFSDLPLKYIQRVFPEQELGMHVNVSEPTTWHFLNERSTNKWGELRGYAIVPGTSTVQLLPPSHPLTKGAAWTKYSLAVTQQHDDEYRSSASMYDMWSPGEPVVSMDAYMDGESVTDADLVGWVTMGVQHVPRSEDVPLIQNFYANFFIKPFNYFDELASINAGADDADTWTTCAPDFSGEATYQWSL